MPARIRVLSRAFEKVCQMCTRALSLNAQMGTAKIGI
jgi:hypothetical protein